MPIVSSVVAVGHPQIDGRRYATESHTTNLGEVVQVDYLAAVGTNYQAVANVRAVLIAAGLAQQEFEALLNGV